MYFSNSHDEARLADPGDADHGDELRALLVGSRVEQLLDEPELAVAADERRLERRPCGPRPRCARRPASARQSWHGCALPLISCTPASA